MGSWGNFITVVKERENYLARTAGNHAFPWRMAIVAKDDKELLTNEMIYLLAKPQQIKDTDWIRPGKATWEWWHCAILEKAPFPSGHQNLSTQMYKYYIDFASENKIPYLLVDAGWSNVFNHADLNKNIDIKEVIRYGKAKKSRCMALDCCCYFIPASALLFGFYQQVGCCWGENRFF